MWICASCRTEIDNRYPHCWNCGAQHSDAPPAKPHPVEVASVPHFASYEQMVSEPISERLFRRRGPFRYVWALAAILIFKLISSPFIGKYGNYIVLIGGVIILLVVLW